MNLLPIKASIAGTVAVLCFLSTAVPLEARPPQRPAGDKKTARVLEDLKARLLSVENALKAGNPTKAYRGAEKLLEEMTNSFVSGSSVGQFLAAGTLLRAVAAYRLGNRDEGHWFWQVANQLYPSLDQLDMSAYQDAISYFREQDATPTEFGREGLTADPEPELTTPEKKKAPMPKIPAAKRGSGKISIEVLVIIDRDGRLTRPQIRQSQGELTLLYATFEALSRWRFKPAEADGEPVPSFYNLRVNFKT